MKIRRGSATVSMVPVTMKVRGKTYRFHRLRYFLDGKLHRPTFKREDDARAEADRIAALLANGRDAATSLTPAQAASYARAIQILAENKIEKPLELVTAEYIELKRAQNPDPRWQKSFPDLVTEFLAHKDRDGTRHLQRLNLKYRLGVLARVITVPLVTQTAAQLTAILDDLQQKNAWSNRSRNHYRAALSNAANWARGRYLPRTWNEIEFVPKHKETDGPVIIYTPEEAEAIFRAAEKKLPKLIPTLVLMFYLGHRSSEATGNKNDQVPPLDWRDLNLDSGEGFLEAGKVRAAGNRITYIPENARAWLRHHRKAAGPICPYKNLNNQIAKLCRLGQLTWKANAARRSYISYRLAVTKNLALVSEETGTSVGTLRKRYRRPITLTVGEKYFTILPAVRAGQATKKKPKPAKSAKLVKPRTLQKALIE